MNFLNLRSFSHDPFKFQDIAVSYIPAITGLSIGAGHAFRLVSDSRTRTKPLSRPSADFLLIRDETSEDHAGDFQAQLVASFVAGRVGDIGIVPEVDVFRADPYLVARAIASLDILSGGRAGFIPLATPSGVAETGYATTATDTAFVAEFTEAVGKLWNNWQPGALVRDWATNRYIDNSRILRADHRGRYFSVDGPLPTPTAVQAAPAFLARHHEAHAFIASGALAVIHHEVDTGAEGLVEIDINADRLPQGFAGAGVVLRVEEEVADWESLVALSANTVSRLGLQWQPSAETLTGLFRRAETISISGVAHV